VPAERLRARDERLLERLRARPSFLMVGSIEPRKAHRQVIAGFEQLWARGVEAQLVIVGREGWRNLPEAARRDIPDLVGRLRSHPQRDRRLFWLDGIDDALLERVYAASVCLIAASEDEGFGLPIVEAARHGVPVLARDIAVFREVAPPGTAYFSGADPGALAEAVGLWLQARSAGTARAAASVQVVTWKESAEQLLQVVRGQVR
jgi:glycosyltransferase involved in cell wall biosynthesis